MNKKLVGTMLCASLAFTTNALAMSKNELIDIAKETEFSSCDGQTLEEIVDSSVKGATWKGTMHPTGGNSVTIQGKFRYSNALMGMQFKVNDDETLTLRIMLVNGLVKSMDDSLLLFTEMCKGNPV